MQYGLTKFTITSGSCVRWVGLRLCAGLVTRRDISRRATLAQCTLVSGRYPEKFKASYRRIKERRRWTKTADCQLQLIENEWRAKTT